MNLYDKIYQKSPIYKSDLSIATDMETKFHYVSRILEEKNPTSIIDIGCGQGHYVRKMLAMGYNAVGLEYSKHCCDTFLQDIPHICASVHDYVKMVPLPKFDCIVCMDVLEHLTADSISSILAAYSEMSNTCIFGIANHSDIHLGVELHLIQKGEDWWLNKIIKHFPASHVVASLYDGRFFIIRAEK